MRLAFVTATPQNTLQGSGTFVGNAHLINHLRQQGHTVDLYTPSTNTGPFGFTVHRFLWNVRLDPRHFQGYDVVVGLDMDGFALAPRLSVPFISYIHGIIADEATFEQGWVRQSLQLQARAERFAVHRAAMVITTSFYARQRLAHLYAYPAARIQLVPPPIDLALWDTKMATLSPSVPPTTRPTILCVGVQYPRKNVATLIQAVALLRPEMPEIELRIASRGPELPRLQQLAASLELNETVRFLGHLPFDDLLREYKRCTLFCLPSLQEGFGLVFAEAMASHKPIIASRAAAVPEVVQDGVFGLLATPRDPYDMAAKLATVLRNPDLAHTLGAAGRHAVTNFDAALIAQRFSQLLHDSLMAPRGSPTHPQLVLDQDKVWECLTG